MSVGKHTLTCQQGNIHSLVSRETYTHLSAGKHTLTCQQGNIHSLVSRETYTHLSAGIHTLTCQHGNIHSLVSRETYTHLSAGIHTLTCQQGSHLPTYQQGYIHSLVSRDHTFTYLPAEIHTLTCQQTSHLSTYQQGCMHSLISRDHIFLLTSRHAVTHVLAEVTLHLTNRNIVTYWQGSHVSRDVGIESLTDQQGHLYPPISRAWESHRSHRGSHAVMPCNTVCGPLAVISLSAKQRYMLYHQANLI